MATQKRPPPTFIPLRFRLHGTWKSVVAIERRALTATQITWLIPLRPQIRDIRRRGQTLLLAHLLEYPLTPEQLKLRIWLRGLARGSRGTREVARHATTEHPGVRKEVIRALIRMHAWSQLREIAGAESNPRLKCLATGTPTRPFSDRLTDDLKNRRAHPPSATRHPLFVSDQVRFHLERAARPWWLIRDVLERIRLLVRGA